MSVLLVGSVAAIAQAGSVNVGGGDGSETSAAARDLDGRHLYLVPATADGDAAIDEAGARVVADYSSFTLVSADGSAHERLKLAGADRRDDMRTVAAADGTLDPADEPRLEPERRIAGRGPVRRTDQGRLARRAAQDRGHGRSPTWPRTPTWSTQRRTRPPRSPSSPPMTRVRGVPFTAADKTAPGLAGSRNREGGGRDALGQRPAPLPAPDRSGRRTSFAAAPASARRSSVRRDRGRTLDRARRRPGGRQRRAVGRRRSCSTSGPRRSSPGSLNAARHGADRARLPGFLTAQGFPTIADELHGRHHRRGPRQGRGAAARRLASRLLRQREPGGRDPDRLRAGDHGGDSNARDCGGHGTNVASIATGFNSGTGATVEDAQGFNYGIGIAPRARVGATKIFNCAGSFDVSDLVHGARLQRLCPGRAGLEQLLGRARERRLQRRLAGVRLADPRRPPRRRRQPADGRGLLGRQRRLRGEHDRRARHGQERDHRRAPPRTSASIGSTDGCGVTDAGANSAKDIIDFSSRGPTDDGGRSPTSSPPAPMSPVPSRRRGAEYNGSGTCNPQFPAGSTLYSLVSGTSQAAPETTGFAALIRDWYAREEGGGPRCRHRR